MSVITFKGVGIDTDVTDIGNYRIISSFENEKGLKCFVEIAHFEKNGVLLGTLRQAYKLEGSSEKHLFRTFNSMYDCTFPFTLNNVLRAVNRLFDCHFTEVNVITRAMNNALTGGGGLA